MAWLVSLAIVSGMAFLVMSLPSIASILRMLGRGRLRTGWLWLRGLIFAFIAGYAAFGFLRLGSPLAMSDLIVSLILSSGGAFVLIVARLSDLTTNDIVRISALERDAIRDPLTGLFNRRYLDAKLVEETDRSRRSATPFSTLIIDIDRFKHVNDTYGHSVGDQVIRHVSRLLVETARSADTVARFGGEEFVVLAPDCDLDQVAVFGEQIREEIAVRAVPLPDGRELMVTASLGVATFAREETPAELLQRADRALYRAKQNGRNRTCRSEDHYEAVPT
ncbi:GGDEF domain-containing protein [Sphingomonas sp. GM_Shp_1]|uniref:GGDEF domain-containing protein n=1 Tax=Sphingomonas sp. GM_Shp_1 TaxID=2937381 RepID=UPI00226B52CF|nr:GGDEF domain-containing protein [Sphingomonas sp. GM_Shp_1]